MEKQIQGRYDFAKKIFTQKILPAQLEQVLAENYQQKEHLCLSLEVLTGQQSPDNEEQKRLEFQIEQMNSSVAVNNLSMDEIVDQWHVLANFKQHTALEERFNNITK